MIPSALPADQAHHRSPCCSSSLSSWALSLDSPCTSSLGFCRARLHDIPSPHSPPLLSPMHGIPRSCPSFPVSMTFTLSLGSPKIHVFPSHPNAREPQCLFPAQVLLPSVDGDTQPWLNLGREEHAFHFIHLQPLKYFTILWFANYDG